MFRYRLLGYKPGCRDLSQTKLNNKQHKSFTRGAIRNTLLSWRKSKSYHNC